MGARGRAKRDDVVRITNAPQNRADDIDRRRRRYIISMTIRTLSFVAAVLVGPGWLRWVLIAAAMFLPYVAVVMANSAAPRIEGTDLVGPGGSHRELER